jgi:hypothetical protein
VPPLSHQINVEASTETAELILNGTSSDEELDAITKMLIEHLKKVSEPVVTSSIRCHLGHYKAYHATHTCEKETLEYDAFEKKRQAIIDAHLPFLNYHTNYVIGHGHSFDRWKKSLP